MNEIIVRTQAEFDALPEKFDVYTRIYIQNDPAVGRIVVRKTAWENASVVARGNASVVARGNASVMARGNASVEARGNASVVARGNASVEAWENASVEARGNASVEAWENVGVHLQSEDASVVLFGFAVCWAIRKGKITKKSETASIIEPKSPSNSKEWLEGQGIDPNEPITLFKRVSSDWKTQENTSHETLWEVGKTQEHPAWNPTKDECGGGKFHACSRPYFCDEFRYTSGDKYVAIQVDVKDLFVWTGDVAYPHKIAFRKGTVLFECDRFGKKKD